MTLRIRVRSVVAAPVEVVWELLRDPARWPDFEIRLSAVEGEGMPLEAGQSLTLVGRAPVPRRVPAEVRVIHPLQRLGLTVHTLPGVTEEVDHLLVPLPRDRTDLEVRVTLDGPLALAAYGALRVSTAVVARQLARAAERLARSTPGTAAV